ncbi:MAG: hprA 2 [Planctomycetaceae bacterium]|nr:hprA 2 [Planctomycetaceae bacterium]
MSARWRVLLTDRAWPDSSIEREILGAVGAEVIEAPATDEATLSELAADADAIGTNWAQVTARVIERCTRCRVVSRFGIGLDNIAVDFATQRGIPVTNVPDYCVTEVAEHTLALLLAAARNIAYFHLQTKAGEYNLAAAPPMRRLAGQTLGLIGLGRIGSAVAERAQALGMNVSAHTASGVSRLPGVQSMSLEEVLRQSDFISLHAPLTNSTRGLIKLPQLQLMKPTAWIINTSRGGLIDPQDLWVGLQQNMVAGAALDVFSPEPPDLSQPLYRDPRVIVTPHAAFVSQESLQELRMRAARQIAAVLSGKTPENVVNGIA